MTDAMNWGDSRNTGLTAGPWRAGWAALVAACGLLCAPLAQAQNIVNGSGDAQAVIITPLSLVKVRDMDFGKIVPSVAGGSVTIDPVTSACSAVGVVSVGNACQAAMFVGMGRRPFRARVTMSNITQLTGPGAAMTMDTFVVGANSTITFTGNINSNGNGGGLLNGGGNQRYNINSSTGIFELHLGATLRVNPNQAPGVYTGTYSVTVQYN